MNKASAVCAKTALAVGIFAPSFSSVAVCLEQKPSIENESRASAAVAVVTPLRKEHLQEDPKDPIGITATRYTLRRDRILHGYLPKRLHIRDENISGRFPMEVGVPYLVFINAAKNEYWIDHCGNAGSLRHGHRVIEYFNDRKKIRAK
jgi:hypothetical protein